MESTRWPAWDYAAPGYYFVTICAKGPFFGEIFRDGTMWLSAAGIEAARCWAAIPQHAPRVIPDIFVVMPDHVHGIVAIAMPELDAEADPTVEMQHAASLRQRWGIAPPLQQGSLSVVVRSYKSRSPAGHARMISPVSRGRRGTTTV